MSQSNQFLYATGASLSEIVPIIVTPLELLLILIYHKTL